MIAVHPVFFQPQSGRVLFAERLQIGSSKAFNAMLDLEKKVFLGRSVGDNPDREQKNPLGPILAGLYLEL